MIEGVPSGGYRVQFNLAGGFKAVVSLYVGSFIGFGMGFDLFCGGFGGGEVVEAA